MGAGADRSRARRGCSSCAPTGSIAGLRRWLLIQLKWIRRPGYRRMLKIYGWLLFVAGALLALILILTWMSR